jgi:hypothetical protein
MPGKLEKVSISAIKQITKAITLTNLLLCERKTYRIISELTIIAAVGRIKRKNT